MKGRRPRIGVRMSVTRDLTTVVNVVAMLEINRGSAMVYLCVVARRRRAANGAGAAQMGL